MDNSEEKQELPDDNKIAFVPVEDIRSIGHVLEQMEQVQKEIRKITEKMTPFDIDHDEPQDKSTES
jgi:hypothetical protein